MCFAWLQFSAIGQWVAGQLQFINEQLAIVYMNNVGRYSQYLKWQFEYPRVIFAKRVGRVHFVNN